MQLRFKLTDITTGADWTSTDCVLDPNGSVLFVVGGDTIRYEEDMSRIIPRLFTGLHDAAGNEIYDGDVLKQNGKTYYSPYFVVKYSVDSFFCANHENLGSALQYKSKIAVVAGNRWQPEFKGVFGND